MTRFWKVVVMTGVVLDLFISGWLWHSQAHNDCWSNVLDNAVTKVHLTPPQKAALYREAQGCRSVGFLP